MEKTNLVLYRGITLPIEKAEQIKDNILKNGLTGDEWEGWRFPIFDFKNNLEYLFNKPDLTIKDTRSENDVRNAICACGDEMGASYYALKHNRHRNTNEISLVIKFSVPISDLNVDGRDFLYPCFQFWDHHNSNSLKLQKEWLKRIYGVGIVRYFDKATLAKEHMYRIAMCDLAIQDSQIINDHSNNVIPIGGRYYTVFCSAFFVRLPIQPNQIISVEQAMPKTFQSQISVYDFIEGNLAKIK